MSWLVFSYSLTSQRSSTRVGFWRRLQQLGTLSLKNGLSMLPDREECLEAFQWLAQEVQKTKGEATIMRVDRFEGMTDAQLIELFHAGCRKKYEQIDRQVAVLENRLQATAKKKDATSIGRIFTRLQRQWEEIARIYFLIRRMAGSNVAASPAETILRLGATIRFKGSHCSPCGLSGPNLGYSSAPPCRSSGLCVIHPTVYSSEDGYPILHSPSER